MGHVTFISILSFSELSLMMTFKKNSIHLENFNGSLSANSFLRRTMDHKRQNEEFYEAVKKFHENRNSPDEKEISEDNCVQHTALLPKLRAYQEKAVQWMIYREKQQMEDVYLDMCK